jgi:hypothetical protein
MNFMRLICLAACLLFLTLTAVSQSKPIKLSFFSERANTNAFLFPVLKNHHPLPSYRSSISTIKILPVDNMPCLITDISVIAPIPTGKFDPQGQTIPNPYFNLATK